MTVIEQLGAYVAQGSKKNSASEERVPLHIADTVAAWVAGSRSSEGRALMEFGQALAGGSADRVMVNCAVTRLSEVDDIHLASGTTPGSVVIPAAVTLGAELGASAAVIRQSILAGYEAMIRLGAAIKGPSILYRGIWPTYFTAPFGVAAVASRLMDLDETRAAHALALALVAAAPGVGHPSGPKMARWLALGQAARQGVLVAQAAKAGFTGDLHLLEKDFFSSVYAITPELAKLTDQLGTTAALAQVSFKPWCAARQTIAASQAVKEMAAAGLKPETVSAVRVAVPPLYLKMVNHGVVPGDRSSYLTSVPCQVALSLLDPAAQFSLQPDPARITAEVSALMSKVTVEADEALLQHFPATWPASVSVTSASGTQERLMLHVPGDPQRSFDERQTREKFDRVLAPLTGPAVAERLWKAAGQAALNDGAAKALVQEIGTAAGA